MSNVIPEAIIHDIQTISALIQGQQDTLINDQGQSIELAVHGDSECGGLILAFDSPHSLSYIEGEYDYERFLRSMDPVRTTAERLFDNTYLLSTEVVWEGVEPTEFVCIYDFEKAQGLPRSMYQAYAYLRSELHLPREAMLEIFGSIVTALPINEVELFRTGNGDTMGGFFDVEKAIAHDLKTQRLID